MISYHIMILLPSLSSLIIVPHHHTRRVGCTVGVVEILYIFLLFGFARGRDDGLCFLFSNAVFRRALPRGEIMYYPLITHMHVGIFLVLVAPCTIFSDVCTLFLCQVMKGCAGLMCFSLTQSKS